MAAQAVLHREILHVHATLNLVLHVLRAPLAIAHPSFLHVVTCPHLQLQLRGLETSIIQTRQATYTALHYTQELLTTFGLMHITRFDPDELAAELRGISSNFQNWARTFTPPGGEPPLPSSTTSLGAASGPIDTVSTRRSPHTTTRPRPGLPRPRERSRSRVRLSPHYTLVSPYFNLFAQNAATFVPNSSPLDRPSRSPTRCDVMTIPMGKNFEL